MNQSSENMDTVEVQEKTTLMPPTTKRPMEKSQRALIWSDSTPLINLLMAYAMVWLLVIIPAHTMDISVRNMKLVLLKQKNIQ